MRCPKCEKGNVVFQNIVGWDPEVIEVEFVCLGCDQVFWTDVDEHDLREVRKDD